MKPQISVITLGVRDLARAREFYVERLGWPVQQEDDNWVCVLLGSGDTAFALYPWDELAEDARVPPEGDGFRGVTLAYNVRSQERVGECSPRPKQPAARSSSRRSPRSGAATEGTSPTRRATSGKSPPARRSFPSRSSVGYSGLT